MYKRSLILSLRTKRFNDQRDRRTPGYKKAAYVGGGLGVGLGAAYFARQHELKKIGQNNNNEAAYWKKRYVDAVTPPVPNQNKNVPKFQGNNLIRNNNSNPINNINKNNLRYAPNKVVNNIAQSPNKVLNNSGAKSTITQATKNVVNKNNVANKFSKGLRRAKVTSKWVGRKFNNSIKRTISKPIFKK